MAHVLVTGGAGFIGSHLCDALLAGGHEVTALDDLSTGAEDNLAQAGKAAGFRFVRADVRQPLAGKFDRVFHMACPASPVHYQRDPVRTLDVAVNGTMRVLELARTCGARVLLASTSEIYGDPKWHPQPEHYAGNVDTQGVRACYDEGKRAAETLAADFHRAQGVDVRIARIFNTYGPRMALDDGRVITEFIVAALRKKPLQLAGGGSHTRSFCFITDMVAGLLALMDYVGPHAHQPMNLGATEEISVRDLAGRIVYRTRSQSGLSDAPGGQGDPARRCPDISQARKLIGFDSKVKLDDGLALTVDWVRAELQRQSSR